MQQCAAYGQSKRAPRELKRAKRVGCDVWWHGEVHLEIAPPGPTSDGKAKEASLDGSPTPPPGVAGPRMGPHPCVPIQAFRRRPHAGTFRAGDGALLQAVDLAPGRARSRRHQRAKRRQFAPPVHQSIAHWWLFRA